MKVFISWSGERSHYVAKTLYDWIGNVNHFVNPWLSEEIPKGARWSPEVAKALDETKFGIFCVTPENQSEPWLNFEAGAISKTVTDKTHVCPYLIDLKPTDIVGPLKEFQLTKTDREDTFRLMRSMNEALGEPALADDRIKSSFDKWWPDLEEALKKIPPPEKTVPKGRDPNELQEETLEIVRQINNTLNTLATPSTVRFIDLTTGNPVVAVPGTGLTQSYGMGKSYVLGGTLLTGEKVVPFPKTDEPSEKKEEGEKKKK